MSEGASRYGWDDRNGQFRDLRTGRFVRETAVRGAVDQVTAASAARMRAASVALREGALDVAGWRAAMAAEIRTTHLAVGMVAEGGRNRVTAAGYGRIGAAIKEQYRYLDAFAADIASGRQAMNGTIDRRAAMYADAARGGYEAARRRVKVVRGYVSHRSVRHATDSCSECIEWEGVGWISTNQVIPMPGERICLTNCKCTIQYSRKTAAELGGVGDSGGRRRDSD